MAAMSLKAVSLTNLLVWSSVVKMSSRSSLVMNGSNDGPQPRTACFSALEWEGDVKYTSDLNM